MLLRLPGLIDPHVHMREPGGTQKEDWSTGTMAALAGGFTMVLAMPNTQPPVDCEENLQLALEAAETKAFCDYGQHLGASLRNATSAPALEPWVTGLKMYLGQTYGPLVMDNPDAIAEHFRSWPVQSPVLVHAEGKMLRLALDLAKRYARPLHVCHVARKEDILAIREAKASGAPVTCEVTPHHMFLTQNDSARIGPTRASVSPALATLEDQEALWDNLEAIDCFATDHAPHTLQEKDSPHPPPGFPGLETALPLWLTAVHEGRLTMEDIIDRMVINPRRIFHLPAQPSTWIEVDPQSPGVIRGSLCFSRSGWTPFEGWKVYGRVVNVMLRGQLVYSDHQIVGKPGFGKNVRPSLLSNSSSDSA